MATKLWLVTEQLRVSFDATAVPADPVGAGRYTIDLARALGSLGDVEMNVWCRAGDGRRLAAEIGTSGHLMAAAPRPRVSRLAWEQISLPRLVDRLGVDVHHAPHYTMPERAKTPVVVTVHDLTFFDHPEWHERSKVLLFRRAISVAARKASVLVCVSATTAERLQEHTNPEGSVVVVPHGVDGAHFHPASAADAESDAAILKSLGVQSPYVCFVGTLEPRKAVPDLVRAFDKVASTHKDLSLVIAGGRGWGGTQVDEAISDAVHRDRILVTGYVPDVAVPVLMRRAAVVAYPALEEGFGLPALEALACGTPLVTTAGSVMAEVAGEAAQLVAAGDSDALADAICEAVDGGEAVSSRVAAGRLIAASHTWEQSARGHVEAYRLAAATASGG